MRELRGRGHEVLCVTPALSGCDEAHEGVIRLPSLPLPTRTAYRLTVPILPRARGAALRRLGIIHTHSPFVTGWLGARLARRLHAPLVFTYHTQLEQYVHYAPFEAHAARSVMTALTRMYANAADTVIAPTAAMERRLRSIGVRAPIEVVPSGIDVASFRAGRRSAELRARLGAPPDAALVLWIGRLGREKNLPLALETIARMESRVHLAVVGDGIERAVCERAAASLAPGRAHFAGELSREALPDVYACGDALLFTSASETQGLVLVEALASGLAIVAVDTPQSREVLGEAACFCEASAQALAEGLRAALEEDPGRRAGRQAAAARYDESAAAARVLSIYASLVTRETASAFAL